MPSLSFPGTFAALLVAGAVAGHPRPVAAQSLHGSPASVDRMYEQAVGERLPFHETSGEVRSAAREGALVRLATGRNVTLKNVGFPYATPTARTFVERLGSQYRATCGKPLVVTSAARPATRQPANSVAQSVHPTGMAVDLRKPTGKCLRWLRTTLLDLEKAGVIEATEEFRPPHFHVAVFSTPYARYAAAQGADAPAVSTQVAAARPADEAPARRARAVVATAPAKAAPRSTTRTAPKGAAKAPTLVAAGGDVYRVRPGDTLWDIARAHDVTVRRLRTANRLARSGIKPGQRLVIPAEPGPAASATGEASEQ
jgi:LysM repeat protein